MRMAEAQDAVFFRTEGGIVVPAVTAEQMREVDRVAVAGHNSMLLDALLHLTGHDLPL